MSIFDSTNFPKTVPGDEKLKVTLECQKLTQHNSRKSYIKNIFKVGAKMAKIGRQNFFFDPPKNKKPSVQKVPPYGIYGDI